MTKRFFASFLLACFCVLLVPFLGFAPSPALAEPAATVNRDKTFVIGRITENPKKHHAALEEMATYILTYLKDFGYEAIDVVIAQNVEDMLDHMRAGEVDIISETAFGAVRLVDEANAEALLREWKKGVASYRSVFFAANDTGISTLADLKGKRILFEDAGSTSGFFIPLSILRQAGLETVELESLDQTPPPDKVGYYFTMDEMTELMLVARGQASAGAFSNLNWADFENTAVVRKSLNVFHESAPVMRSVFLVRASLPAPVKERIAQTLLNMDKDQQGREVLKTYNKVKQYDRLSGEEMANSLAIVREWSGVLGDIGK